jgi:hydrogenase expression/formation protein HypD
MQNLSDLRNPALLRPLAKKLRALPAPPAALMEVCGTHTVAIARYSIRAALPPGVRLISGPGCPVCVTPQAQIDHFIALGKLDRVTLATFGDMLRVPGSERNLEQARAEGVDVLVVYSPMDAVAFAERSPEREVVFFGIGFETTAPTVALALAEAKRRGFRNFSVLSAHKTIPAALVALTAADIAIDGFLCPGHVSVIIGSDAYRPIAARGKPCVVAGFEPADILRGLHLLLRQLIEGRSEVEVEYQRAVTPEGNRKAQQMLARVFRPVDAAWRGIGTIPGSGYRLRPEYAAFDAELRFGVASVEAQESPLCIAGQILQGTRKPHQCSAFGTLCTPEHPLGAPMVSSEGACAAYYRYHWQSPAPAAGFAEEPD